MRWCPAFFSRQPYERIGPLGSERHPWDYSKTRDKNYKVRSGSKSCRERRGEGHKLNLLVVIKGNHFAISCDAEAEKFNVRGTLKSDAMPPSLTTRRGRACWKQRFTRRVCRWGRALQLGQESCIGRRRGINVGPVRTRTLEREVEAHAKQDCHSSGGAAGGVPSAVARSVRRSRRWYVDHAVAHTAEAMRAEDRQKANLVRHILGNPFHLYRAPLSWPPAVVSLAGAVYCGSATFGLHDTLLESGHPDLAAHFREQEWHPKGCHVVDLILNKA